MIRSLLLATALIAPSLAHAQMVLSGPRGEAQADKPHVMAAVIGVRGGVGASTIATSLAWMFGEKARRSTALLDLDVHFGTGALALDWPEGGTARFVFQA